MSFIISLVSSSPLPSILIRCNTRTYTHTQSTHTHKLQGRRHTLPIAHLEKRVTNAVHVMLWRIPRHYQVLQQPHQVWYKLQIPKKTKSSDCSNEQGLTRLKCGSESGFAAHISVTRQTPVRRTAWFFSLSSCRVVGTNTSIRSGTLRMILIAHRAACVCECLFVVVVYLFVVVVCVLMNLADDVRVG